MAKNTLTIALAGNQNSGKTTLFNALTGLNQFVGNWPGVTVERKEGKLKENKAFKIVDLPGIYSLSPYSPEEIVSRDYLTSGEPDVILNIIDSTNIERSLFLTTQLCEIGVPVVCALNMIDIARAHGDKINIKELSAVVGCPFIEISATKEIGVSDIAALCLKTANETKHQVYTHSFGGVTEHALAHIEEHALESRDEKYQSRYYAIKIFERDEKIIEKLSLDKVALSSINNHIVMCEQELDDDSESIMVSERYAYIDSIIEKCVQKKKHKYISLKIDAIITNRFLALPIFAVIMFLVYYISVSSLGGWVTELVNDGIFGEGFSFFGLFDVPSIPGLIEGAFEAANVAPWISSLVLDGIVGGVGAVLGFVPQIMILFLLLAFLEGSGYMARIAFILDRVFRRFGLSGKSFIPILIGTGCGVPGIMASRTIENEADRRMTVMTTTFIPCSAKLPVIALIAGALMNDAWWVAPVTYFVGALMILLSGLILKRFKAFKSSETPFVMELPAYHMPTISSLFKSMWDRSFAFIKKAGSVILLSCIVIWFLSNFGFGENGFGMVDIEDSILKVIGSVVAPIFAPLGFGNWQAAVASITGLIAKENLVGTLAVLYNFSEEAVGAEASGALSGAFTQISAFSFLMFNMLCVPCFAALGAMRREMQSAKWFWGAVAWQMLVAYVVALVIYWGGNLLCLVF